MQRALIVLSTTALGLTGVLSYHVAGSSTPATATKSTSAPTTAHTTSTATTTATATGRKTTASAATVRSATGTHVSFRYGDLQVNVTMSAGKVTGAQVVQLNVTDPHSDQIDQSAIPALTQEALAAGSAKINAISGASYTSAAYEQSLQSAIDKLTSTASAA